MSSSFFLKCEKCENKPATIRLYSGAQEKKVCFQCERELVSKPQYKEWNKQFIPYSDLKKSGTEPQVDQSRHSNISSISKVDSGLRSPTPVSSSIMQKTLPGSIYRDRSEKMSDSFLAKSPSSQIDPIRRTPRAIETVSPKVGIGKKSFDITKPTIETDSNINKAPTGVIRPNTPKKNGFYSDYLQDYNPKNLSFKSPTAGALKREIADRTSRSYSSTSFINPMMSGRASSRQPEKGRNSSTYAYETGRTSNRAEVIEPHRHEAPALKTSQINEIKIPVAIAPDHKLATEETERRARDAKKDEIRNRISKLNEQFYSPIRSPAVQENKLLNTDETSLSIDFRDNKLFNNKKDYSGIHQRDSVERLSARQNSVEEEQSKAIRRGEETNEDYKQKLTVQGYESTIANLKSHLDSVERRNGETITKLREEVRHLREELLKERTGTSSSNNKEVSNLQGNVVELEKRLEDQQNKYKQLEERSEQNKASSDKRVAELKEELERTRKEKDRRIEELNNQIKSLNKSHKEAIESNQRENENFIKKLKTEYDLISRDLNKQIDSKDQEIDRLKQEKEELTRSNSARVSTLQESLKHHQEINNRLRLETRGDDSSARGKYNQRGSTETPIKDTSS